MKTKLNDDIKYLNDLLKIKELKDVYKNYFCWLYPFTNENISGYYKMLNFKNKNVLTVTSSGDHALNAFLLGADTVDCFDINPLAKYYSELKNTAIKSITLEEFLLFFYNKNNIFERKFYFNKNLYYKKIRQNLTGDYKIFWDYVFEKYTSKKIINSFLFTNDVLSFKNLLKVNDYLNEDNYYKLRNILKNKKINYIDKNIVEIVNNKKRYNLLLFSNIPSYLETIYVDQKIHLKNLKQIIESLKTEDASVVVNYFYNNLFICDFDNIYTKDEVIKYFPKDEYEYKDINSAYSLNLSEFLIKNFSLKDRVLITKNIKKK